jgi:hypothetical protein
MTAAPSNGKQPNSQAGSIAALSDVAKNMNWPTLILIIVTGGGNWFSNQQNTSQLRTDQYHAYQQVQELHNNLDDFEKRQKTLLQNMDQSLRNQTQMLKNQSDILTSLHQNQNK